MIHLDANFLIDSLVPGSGQEAALTAWLSAGESIGISAMAWGEFLCGPLSPAIESLARQLLPSPEPLTGADADKAAQLFNATGRRSRSFADCCVAAVALRTGSRLATSNTADFEPFRPHGLLLA
jgi:predicted nucleic acid-binding protein